MMVEAYSLGETMAVARKDSEISQTQLAQRVGVSRQTISSFEQGKADSIAFGTICRIVTELGYELELHHGLTVTFKPSSDPDTAAALFCEKYNL